MENSAFLGRGWSFPPVFQDGGKSVAMVEGETDIAQSLMILFTTRLRERVLHHGYGTDFEAYIFEDIDAQLHTNIQKMITDAVETYEPRIQLQRIDFVNVGREQGHIQIELEFTIKGTNARHNLVFPFNLAEGSLYQQIINN
jgi:phage baseplate assembly protein W